MRTERSSENDDAELTEQRNDPANWKHSSTQLRCLQSVLPARSFHSLANLILPRENHCKRSNPSYRPCRTDRQPFERTAVDNKRRLSTPALHGRSIDLLEALSDPGFQNYNQHSTQTCTNHG